MSRSDVAARTWQASIGGVLRAAGDGATYQTVDPTTEQVLADVPECTAADIDAAVAGAHDVQRDWAALAPGPAGSASSPPCCAPTRPNLPSSTPSTPGCRSPR